MTSPADSTPQPPARSRGVIGLEEGNCTVCMICARECPDWCIYIDGHQETDPGSSVGPSPEPARRPVQRNVLDRFAIDFGLCMYCGICVDACPFDALFWAPAYDYPEGEVNLLVHEIDRLTGWMAAVPSPPDLDRGTLVERERGGRR